MLVAKIVSSSAAVIMEPTVSALPLWCRKSNVDATIDGSFSMSQILRLTTRSDCVSGDATSINQSIWFERQCTKQIQAQQNVEFLRASQHYQSATQQRLKMCRETARKNTMINTKTDDREAVPTPSLNCNEILSLVPLNVTQAQRTIVW